MKVVVAIDSFKGSLSSIDAGNAAKAGILKVYKDADVVVKPLADGGEGTTEALVDGLGGELVYVDVTGPLGERTRAKYGILSDRKTAVMEMAQAAGITLLKREALNPWKATTFGVGEMIADAVNRGCREFIVGIGGSATTDGGVGMLQALGVEFLDSEGNEIGCGICDLDKIEQIRTEHMMPELRACHFQIACDVKNPLCGKNGAVYVFGAQKGVKESEKSIFDEKMRHYADMTEKLMSMHSSEINMSSYITDMSSSGTNMSSYIADMHSSEINMSNPIMNTRSSCQEGAGAAGGLGFAFLNYFPNAQLKSGIDIVLAAVELEKVLADADIVITGEGCLDFQTAMGKVPVGVARLAKKYGCKVIAFAGGVTKDAGKCNDEGIDAFFPIVRGVTTLDEAMAWENAGQNMSLAVEQAFRLIRLFD